VKTSRLDTGIIKQANTAQALSEYAWRARRLVAACTPNTPERAGARAVELAMTMSDTLPEARAALDRRKLSPEAAEAARKAFDLITQPRGGEG
jgi:hypothetical protein